VSNPGFTRRSALVAAASFGAGAALDHLVAPSDGRPSSPQEGGQDRVSFFAPNQAGIATPAQEFLAFAAYDLTAESLDSLRSLLMLWTGAAATLAEGESYEEGGGSKLAPPIDTGEAVGLPASALTLTFGFGPSLFLGQKGRRLGLAGMRPPALQSLPPFEGEDLDLSRSDGDLCVQACANDAQVAFHAIHVLTKLAESVATLRWGQQGFGRTSSTSAAQPTPRNLMGFKDGTANVRAEDRTAMERFVWVADGDGPEWMVGGSYLVARRIRILFDVWDASTLEEQERTIGRRKLSGAPLGERQEYDPMDLQARRDGAPVIPADAHVRLASPDENTGQRILRRGYSYSEAPAPGSGQLDAGLFFICFQRDPGRQFVPIQRRLASSDALNRHTLHNASALFACPPGTQQGGFIGEGLFT
jgi:deferrochelatase/peroxidase EfeB